MNYPTIPTEAEYQARAKRHYHRTVFGAWLMAALLASVVLGATSCDQTDSRDELRDTATAFYPSKPTHAAQVAYREDAREQLRLNNLIASKK